MTCSILDQNLNRKLNLMCDERTDGRKDGRTDERAKRYIPSPTSLGEGINKILPTEANKRFSSATKFKGWAENRKQTIFLI